MNELALFAGFGGGILGGKLLGWRTVCAVEKDAGRARILAARQNDGLLPPFPIWSDVETFDGYPWRGRVDVVSSGSPCQGFSTAGAGLGLDDPRSRLILEILRITGEVQPRFVLLENSPVIRRKGLALVIGRFADLGYACRWDTFTASGVGAWHQRKRLFLVAYFDPDQCTRERIHAGRWSEGQGKTDALRAERGGAIADVAKEGCDKGRLPASTPSKDSRAGCFERVGIVADALQAGLQISECVGGFVPPEALDERLRQAVTEFDRWPSPPDLVRMVHGVSRRMERIEGLGDAQIPRVVQTAWRHLTRGLLDHGGRAV